MSYELRRVVFENGYVFIAAHKPELETVEAVSLLGSVLTLAGFAAFQDLRPQTKSNSAPNTYSGNFGTGEFPMHTDLAHWAIPPRYFALRCIKGAPDVVTNIFDGRSMIADIGATALRRTLVQPRRPLRNGKQLLRLLDYLEGDAARVLRWDSIFLQPATANSEATFLFVAAYLKKAPGEALVLRNPGDTLIVDNWRMIHRRSPVPPGVADRHIHRVYMGDLH